MTNRYCGATEYAYNVAHHSILVSYLVEEKNAMFALLHDASESFIHDINTPVKRLIEPAYGPLELAFMRAIATKFGFDLDDEEAARDVKKADKRMLLAEVRDLLPCGYVNLRPDVEPASVRIQPWTARRSEEEFLKRFNELCSSSS